MSDKPTPAGLDFAIRAVERALHVEINNLTIMASDVVPGKISGLTADLDALRGMREGTLTKKA